jgi:diacylglycerol O-acyltransferase / wax synthase
MPGWVEDERLDAARHVRSLDAGPADDPQALRHALGRLAAERLPRDRPLWRLDLADAPDGRGSVLVFAAHHCLLDGDGMLRVVRALLFDEAPAAAGERAAPGPAAQRAAPGPSGGAADPGVAAREGRLTSMATRELLPAGASSPLAGRIGARREVALAGVPLDAVRRCAHAAGGATVNDVLLAMVAGGLRRWLAERGATPRGLRVKVPVSLHPADAAVDPLGNRDSYLFVELPLAEPDPGRRLAAISAQTRVRKAARDAEVLDALQRRLHRVPGAERLLTSWTMSPRVFALNVSNVRGPAGPASILGGPLTGMAALAEIAPHHALRVAALSAVGTLSLGLCADAGVVGDPTALADGMAAELGALGSG